MESSAVPDGTFRPHAFTFPHDESWGYCLSPKGLGGRMTAIRFFTDEDVDGATARALRAAGLTRDGIKGDGSH